MAGLWIFSQQQILDGFGKPIVGALAYFYDAETLTPLAIFQDYGLGTPASNPVEADGNGRFPPIYLDEGDGFFRHRVQTPQGVVIIDLSTLPIIGPTGGGGSPSPVDPNALFTVGDPIWSFRTGVRSGWVRANARTIGNATSGATERANADTEALFGHLWQNFDNTLCPVFGGRGASSAADYAANKTISTPDMRGRGPFGLDTMGNVAAGRISTFGNNGTMLGASGGAETIAIAGVNLPAITKSISGTAAVANHTHPIGGNTGNAGAHDHGGDTGNAGAHDHGFSRPAIDGAAQSGGSNFGVDSALVAATTSGVGNHAHTITNQAAHAHSLPANTGSDGAQSAAVTGNTAALGSGTALNKMSPATLGTWYIKLALPLFFATQTLAGSF